MPRVRKTPERRSEAERLRRLRELMGLSQRDLGDELGVTGSAIAQWENAERTMPGPVLRLLELYEHQLGLSPPGEGPHTGARRGLATLRAAALWTLFHGVEAIAPAPIARQVKDASMRRFARSLGDLKGLSMKFAQMASYVDFVLPEEERRALASLHKTARPMTKHDVLDVFLAELGRAPAEVFREWDSSPVAVASIGQVHRATTHEGEQVAVKVQYPRIVDALRADLQGISAFERVLVLMSPAQRPGVLFEELRRLILEECDYRNEAKNLAAFDERFGRDPDLRFPRAIPSLSSARILTTTWLDGQPMDAFLATSTQEERDRAGSTIWRLCQMSILRDAMFHADPHPGNFLFGRGWVGLVDFGRVKRFSAAFIEHSRQTLRALIEGDFESFRRATLAMGLAPRPDDFDFHYAFRAMRFLNQGCLVESPFTFTHAFVTECFARFGARNVNRTRISYPPDMVMLEQLYFGVASLLARLGARVDCRTTMLDLLYRPGERRPPPVTAAELAALVM